VDPRTGLDLRVACGSSAALLPSSFRSLLLFLHLSLAYTHLHDFSLSLPRFFGAVCLQLLAGVFLGSFICRLLLAGVFLGSFICPEEFVPSSETSVNLCQITWRYIPGDHTLHSCQCKNVRSKFRM
jgi:hypothetical protein